MTTKAFEHQHKISDKTFEVEVRSSSESVFSEDSTTSTLLDDASFHPDTTFHIAARGIGVWRLPLPSSEVEIPIYRNDGSLAYTSTREKRSSGNCVLSHPKIGDLVSTTYFFGPNREPVLKLLQAPGEPDGEANSINIKGKWVSRSTAFIMGDGRVFEWSYAHTKDSQGTRVKLIVLRQQEQSEVKMKGDKGGRILAQLVRGKETRAEGSKRCTAGNGGQLMLDQDATSHLDEAVIIATCLMMLKKEIDRRRTIQFMMLSGAASGGS
ncbi:uncharacterized protein A1O9_11166 [Exophiala aquamarina CBS 119918]|uniref:Uncharacterized protein n=1 Tax=Exophiala aquamarina CBS 119918 TaxID=1182545 RepID=A0A072NXZ4_9EURO|nr:uncharacterized protein A1O9_11166 [Exophiala aquamarina CBS 119918]KEF52749.1 hypothetical protein A1O9_11166 [Exophiala aquamarina CBS 119918]